MLRIFQNDFDQKFKNIYHETITHYSYKKKVRRVANTSSSFSVLQLIGFWAYN